MITFEPTETGIEVVDAIERHRYALGTGRPGSPEPADTEEFRVPVEAATRFEAASISLPTVAAVYARDEAGTVVASVDCRDRRERDRSGLEARRGLDRHAKPLGIGRLG